MLAIISNRRHQTLFLFSHPTLTSLDNYFKIACWKESHSFLLVHLDTFYLQKRFDVEWDSSLGVRGTWPCLVLTFIARYCLIFCTTGYHGKLREFGWRTWFITQVLSTTPAGGSAVRWEEHRGESQDTGLCHRLDLGHGFPLSGSQFPNPLNEGIVWHDPQGLLSLSGNIAQTHFLLFCSFLSSSENGDGRRRQQPPCISQDVSQS